MERIHSSSTSMLFLSLALVAGQAGAIGSTVGLAAPITCPDDAVPVGTVCVDKYETSVWNVPDPDSRNKALVSKLKRGTATLADLTAGGAVQLGCSFSPFDHDPFPTNFPPNGNWTSLSLLTPPTPGVYAASVPGVLPSACITWFQSAQACRLSGKRLLTNAEWQDAAAGTPDPGTDDESTDCNVGGPPLEPTHTGSRSSCKSNWGASDMVGNLNEWVADWVSASTGCTTWGFSDDFMCLSGANDSAPGPGALIRGGGFEEGSDAGVFAVIGFIVPQFTFDSLGLRCAR